jgi:hypothetical protein
MALVRTSVVTLLVAMIATFSANDATAQPPSRVTSGITVPITGAAPDVATFTGNFTIQRFTRNGDGIDAVGTVSGTLKAATGETRFIVTQARMPLALPASDPSAAASSVVIQQVCEILHLELGPIDLNLLGLIVHLDPVLLDITADPAGGLLGNLLCAVANLLGTGGAVQQIVDLLQQVLGILG